MSDGIKLDPIWKEAAKCAVEQFSHGEIIPHEWLNAALEIYVPHQDEKITAARHMQLSFERLEKVDCFREQLLEQHQMYLVNLRAEGYKIIMPEQQTLVVMKQLERQIHKILRKTRKGLEHIDQARLDVEQARANAEAKAKLAYLVTSTKQITHDTRDQAKGQEPTP